MNRPYTISHMMMSVDGRIDCPMVAQISGEEYYTALASFGTSSKLSGRVTAALECTAVEEQTEGCSGAGLEAEKYYKAAEADEYTIVVDTRGRLQINQSQADGHPLLVVMSQQVSEAHLEQLSRQGVSWIATGKERIDLRRALEILYATFGVERVVVVGGGLINGGFLQAGLIDEVSVMIAPGVDGRRGETAVFDGCTWQAGAPYRLHLKSVSQVEGTEVLWVRYTCR